MSLINGDCISKSEFKISNYELKWDLLMVIVYLKVNSKSLTKERRVLPTPSLIIF